MNLAPQLIWCSHPRVSSTGWKFLPNGGRCCRIKARSNPDCSLLSPRASGTRLEGKSVCARGICVSFKGDFGPVGGQGFPPHLAGVVDDTMGPPGHRGRRWSGLDPVVAPALPRRGPILTVVLVEDAARAGHQLGGLRRLPAVEGLLHLRA